MPVSKKTKRDALDALLEKQTQVKIAGQIVKFRFATASERVKWLSKFPRPDDASDPMKQSVDFQAIITEVLATLHVPTTSARKRTANEWLNLLTFADGSPESDFGDSATLSDYGLSLMGVSNRQNAELPDQVGANPT